MHRGNEFESQAVRYYISLGYTIVARQYRKPYGEIDIIAKDQDTLVFCEVRGKATNMFCSPEESFQESKRKKLKKTITAYLLEHTYDVFDTDFRFDFIAIDMNGLRHYKGMEL